jgi:hypothetical protein
MSTPAKGHELLLAQPVAQDGDALVSDTTTATYLGLLAGLAAATRDFLTVQAKVPAPGTPAPATNLVVLERRTPVPERYPTAWT